MSSKRDVDFFMNKAQSDSLRVVFLCSSYAAICDFNTYFQFPISFIMVKF